MQFVFGPGALYGVPAAKSGSGVVTPVQFGALQEFTLTFEAPLKELYGQNQFPVAAGRGKGKITGKAQSAQISAAAFNAVFFGAGGGQPSAGQSLISSDEPGVVPAAAPFTVTVANAATFVQDLGVRYAQSGLALTAVSASPTQGQYSVSNGVYTFDSADAGQQMLISYQYVLSTSGMTLVLGNQLQGVQPSFQIASRGTFTDRTGKVQQVVINLYNCISSKLEFNFRLDDFMIPELDFSAYPNAAGQIGIIASVE